jgi:hypothetical protein
VHWGEIITCWIWGQVAQNFNSTEWETNANFDIGLAASLNKTFLSQDCGLGQAASFKLQAKSYKQQVTS